jgi:hypothetical protein
MRAVAGTQADEKVMPFELAKIICLAWTKRHCERDLEPFCTHPQS